MSPAEVEKAPQPPQSSQIVMILMVLLLVLGLGALYFRMTGSLLWYVIGNISFHKVYKVLKVSQSL